MRSLLALLGGEMIILSRPPQQQKKELNGSHHRYQLFAISNAKDAIIISGGKYLSRRKLSRKGLDVCFLSCFYRTAISLEKRSNSSEKKTNELSR